MRNILQYPLTAQDIINTLEKDQKTYLQSGMFGGVHGLVYSQLLAFIKDENNAKLVLDFKASND